MSRSRSQSSTHFLRRLILLLLLVVAAALGLVLLTRTKTDLPVLVLDILTDVGLGLIAGIAVRMLFNGRSGFVRSVASAAAVVIGLGVLGYFTDWKLGIGPLEFGRKEVDFLSLAHLVVAADMSWIVQRLWRPRGSRAVEVSPRGSRSSVPVVEHGHSAHPHSVDVVPNARIPVPSGTRFTARSATTSSVPARNRTKMKRAADMMPVRPRRRGFFRQAPQVQLALVEEHRCPYCLDPVKRNDPRGVRECEICHALHHADCWAITGTCQVPHLN